MISRDFSTWSLAKRRNINTRNNYRNVQLGKISLILIVPLVLTPVYLNAPTKTSLTCPSTHHPSVQCFTTHMRLGRYLNCKDWWGYNHATRRPQLEIRRYRSSLSRHSDQPLLPHSALFRIVFTFLAFGGVWVIQYAGNSLNALNVLPECYQIVFLTTK